MILCDLRGLFGKFLMLDFLKTYLELIRFSHTVFALPFAYIAAMLAWTRDEFRWLDLVGILACMVTARTAAMAFNRLVDRRYDAANPRTAKRHLPAGLLSVPAVTTFTLAACGLFLAATFLFQLREPVNPWPAYLGVPVLLFLLGYSLAKRFTSLAHFWLGAALMLAPLAAWIAILGLVQLETPAALAAVVLFWVAGFDVLYACQDADYDRTAGLHSLPARLGVRAALRLAAGCHAVMFAALIAFGVVTPELRIVYFVGLVPIALLLVYQHSLVKPTDLARVNRAFFQVNAVISFGLLALVGLQLWLKV